MTDDLFPPRRPDRVQVCAELERELAARRRLYPRWVDDGRISAQDAAWRIACLEVAVEHIAGMPARVADEQAPPPASPARADAREDR